MVRKVWRIAKWLLAGVLVLVIAAIIFVHTSWGREVIRKRIEAALQSDFPGSKVGALSGSVFTTLELRDLELAGVGGKPFVKVGYAKVDVGIVPFVTKHVRVDRLELDDVYVDPAAQPPAKPSTSPQPPSPTTWSIELWQLAVHRAHVVLPDNELTDLEVDGSVFVPAEGTLTAIVAAKGAWRGVAFEAGAYVRDAPAPAFPATIHEPAGLEIPLAHVALATGHVDVLGGRLAAAPTGELVAQVQPALVRMFTDYDVPEVVAFAHARAAGGLAFEVHANDIVVRGGGKLDVEKREGEGLITASKPDLGAVAVAVAGSLKFARGIVSADVLRDGHHARELVALGGTKDIAWVLGSMTSDLSGAKARATIRGEVKRDKDNVFELQKSTITAHASGVDVAVGDGGRARIGYVGAELSAEGPVWPSARVRLDGTVDSSGLLYGAFGAGTGALRLTGVYGDKTGVAGKFRVAVGQAMNNGKLLGSGTLDARATIGVDGTVTAVVEDHEIRTASGRVWSGKGGKLIVVPEQIAMRELATGDGTGTVTANATIARDTGDLSADLTAKNVALAGLAPGLAGSLGANVRVTKKSGRWDGTASLSANGVVLAPDRPKLDASVTATVHGRRVTTTVTVASADVGEVRVVGAVDGPADLTNALGWKRLDRSSLKGIAVSFVDVQLAKADKRLSGVVTGDVALTAKDSHGTVRLRDFATKYGAAEGEVTFTGDRGVVDAGITAQLTGLAAGTGMVRAQLPTHLFDPLAWKALGANALLGATFQTHDVAITPQVIAKLGKQAPYTGKLDLDVEVGAAAVGGGVKVAVKQLVGGPLKKPVDAVLAATLDSTGSKVEASAKTGSVPLLALELHSPLTTADALAGNIRTASLAGTIALARLPAVGEPPPVVPARDLLALFARRDVSAGTLAGTIKIDGTIGIPTADASLTAYEITIPASVEGRKPAKLTDLVVKAHWRGSDGDLDILGHEGDTGLVHVTARGRPDQLALLDASFEAGKLDIAPFVAFAPGQFGAAKGTIGGSLRLHGLDPDTGDLKGTVQLRDGRLPLHDLIGTLRAANVDVTIANHTITADLKGKLGRGDVTGKATIALSGSSPKKADIDMTLRQISLIRAFQPQIDAKLVAKLENNGEQWTGDIDVTNAQVVVPNSGGVKLLESYTPADMLFVDGDAPLVSSALQRPPPAHPWLVANVNIATTPIDVQDIQYQVRGAISGHVVLSVGGDEIGLDGAIDAQRGDIQLLGQRSQLDHGSLVFDGTIDPLLNIRVIRDLDEISVACEVTGRVSKPIINFTSEPGGYSQGDLLAFFLGGQPGADRGEVGQAAASAAAGLASSIASQKLNEKLLKRWNIKLDFHYNPATASSSEAIGFSHWFGRNLYVEGRQHPEARPDENANEMYGEYHLGNNTLLEGEIGDRGYAGSDLVHRWHW